MDELKKNGFWIVLGIVMLGALGWYFTTVPPIEEEATAKKNNVQALAMKIEQLARNAGKDDTLKNEEHVSLAKRYGAELDKQISDLQKSVKEMALQAKFEDAASGDTQFDGWLETRRAKLVADAAKAGLTIPQDKESRTVRDMLMLDPTKQAASDEKLHRSYRLRQLAILEEVVAALSKKHGTQQVLKFEGDPLKQEISETLGAGAQVLESLAILSPKESADRTKAVYEAAFQKAGRSDPSRDRKTPPPELPYSVTTVEIQFLANLQAVPGILHGLESSPRYRAVLQRVDYQRATAPYNASTEPKLATAGPVSGLNTHFQEGPVRVIATLDLLEYDKTKEKKADAPKASPKAGNK